MNVTREGDRIRVAVRLASFAETQEAALMTALRDENCHLRFFCADYGGERNMEIFVSALETSGPKRVYLFGPANSPQMIGRFLRAASRNQKLQTLTLFQQAFPASALGFLLKETKSLLAITLARCEVAEPRGDWEDELTNAIHQNNTIRELMMRQEDLTYLTPVVKRLGSHPTTVAFSGDRFPPLVGRTPPSSATTDLIQHVLENTSERRAISCRGFSFNGSSFIPIANGAIGCQRQVALEFSSCSFDEASTEHFESMFRAPSNLRILSLACGSDESNSFAKPMETILRNILNAASPLRSLKLIRPSTRMISAVLEALESNLSLESLCLWGLSADDINANDGAVFLALEKGIPRVKSLKELYFPFHLLTEAQRLRVVQAIKRNWSMTDFLGNGFGWNSFSQASKAELRSHFERNKRLPAMIKCPDKLPLSGWPKIFEIAQQCEYGNTWIFEGLVKLNTAIADGEQKKSPQKLNRSNNGDDSKRDNSGEPSLKRSKRSEATNTRSS